MVPAWHFGERHDVLIHPDPAEVHAAVRSVTAGEIRLFRLLTWVRHPRFRVHPSPEALDFIFTVNRATPRQDRGLSGCPHEKR